MDTLACCLASRALGWLLVFLDYLIPIMLTLQDSTWCFRTWTRLRVVWHPGHSAGCLCFLIISSQARTILDCQGERQQHSFIHSFVHSFIHSLTRRIHLQCTSTVLPRSPDGTRPYIKHKNNIKDIHKGYNLKIT